MSEIETHSLSDLKIDPDKKIKKGFSKTTIFIIAIVVIAVLGFFGSKFLKNKPVKVKYIKVLEKSENSNTSILSASGYVTPRRRATVSSKITGKVKEMLVEEGMIVEKGSILAKLDDANIKEQLNMAISGLKEAKASFNQTKVQLKNAEKEYKRFKSLFDKKMASEQELDNAKTNLDSLNASFKLSKAKIETAKSNIGYYEKELENYVVKAPFKGVAVSKDAEVGEMVSPVSAGGGYTRTGISTIVDMNSLEIEVDVNENYISRVKVGQSVVATLDAYQDIKYYGKVRTIIPTADRQKATVKVRISFNKLDEKILPDMGVKVSFLSDEKIVENKPKILIPKNSVLKDKGDSFVYVINGKKAEKRAITTGKVYENEINVISGLISGEKIAISNIQLLKDEADVILE